MWLWVARGRNFTRLSTILTIPWATENDARSSQVTKRAFVGHTFSFSWKRAASFLRRCSTKLQSIEVEWRLSEGSLEGV